MFISLTIARYPGLRSLMGFFSMILFRGFLRFDSRIRFFKLLGTGSFDLKPDFTGWGMLMTWDRKEDFESFLKDSFVTRYQHFFSTENWTILCQLLRSHGLWDGKEPFGPAIYPEGYQGPVAVLTRATIKPSKIGAFRSDAAKVAEEMKNSGGLIFAKGIGEIPFFKQATFSIWENQETINAFAYKKHPHKEVINNTRTGRWYSEELFARFIPRAVYGPFPCPEIALQFSNNEVLNN